MAPHSSTPAWKIPWTEEPGRLQFMGSLRDTTEWLHFHFSLSCIGEGNGSPLQCSCLENPRDKGAWWASIYGVTQSRTQLKWLSSSSSVGYKIFFFFNLFICTGPSCSMWTVSCRMWALVPRLGIKPGPLALGAQSCSHGTTREVSIRFLRWVHTNAKLRPGSK